MEKSIAYFCGEVEASSFKWRHKAPVSLHAGDGALDSWLVLGLWGGSWFSFLSEILPVQGQETEAGSQEGGEGP